MADRDNERSDSQAQGSVRQPEHDDDGRPDRTARRQGGPRPAGAPPDEVPHGGLNPEIGDMDNAADPDRDPEDDGGALPGRAGGGLMGG